MKLKTRLIFIALAVLVIVLSTILPNTSKVSAADTLDEAENEARIALNGFFDAFNAADNDALQDFCSYPHAFVGREGSIRIIEDRWEMDFDAMRERENWAKSTLDSARAFIVKEDKVHFEIVFSRHNTNGEQYRSVPGLWIMTKQNGQWGLSLRSY